MMGAAVAFPTTPVKYLADVRPSGVDKHTVEGESPVLLCNYTDIYYHDHISSSMEFMEASATESEIGRFSLQAGDVVMTKDSETADDIGIPALVVQDLENTLLGYHNSLLRPDTSLVEPRFLYWALQSKPVKGYWETKARGVTRVGLRADDIAALAIPTPPLAVQAKIADRLDSERLRVHELVGGVPTTGWSADMSLVAQFVGLARLRFAALITAAVTGQIDV